MTETLKSTKTLPKGQKWHNRVKLEPMERLVLSSGGRSKVNIHNGSSEQISYKIKTTRYYSVRPSRTFGVIAPNDSICVKIAYDPRPDEPPFDKADRLTVLLRVVVDGKVPEEVWKQKKFRHVLRLSRDPFSPDSPKNEKNEKNEKNKGGDRHDLEKSRSAKDKSVIKK